MDDTTNPTPGQPTRPTTVSIDQARLGRMRAAVRLVRTKTGRPYTMRQLVAEAIDTFIRRLETDYNAS